MSSCQTDEIVLTGIGIHSAMGDTDATWKELEAGRSAVRMDTLDRVDGLPPIPQAPAPMPPVQNFLNNRKLAKYMSPATAMAVVAAGRALRDAGLNDDDERRQAAGLYANCGLMGFDISTVTPAIEVSLDQNGRLDLSRMGNEGMQRCHPLMPFKTLSNMPLGMVSIAFNIKGENFILYPGGEQSGTCFEAALRNLRSGRLDVALVGGTNHGVNLLPVATLWRTGRLATSVTAAKPHLPDHNGYAPADGACFVVLERRQSALERRARTYASVLRATSSKLVDTKNQLSNQLIGEITRARELGAEVDLVVSTGNLSRQDDLQEQRTIKTLGATRPLLTCIDNQTGHLAAAGLPMLAAASGLMISKGVALPIDGLGDGNRPLLTPDRATSLRPRSILASLYNPDGGMATVLLSQPLERT